MIQKTGPAPPSSALVVKLGGSLYDRVPVLAPYLIQSPRPLLIIPGGGRYADEVRKSSLSDDEAHWMAIRAMNRYGEYIRSFNLPAVNRLKVPEKTTILLPYRCMKKYDPLPHSWNVTSDTIAAWIADILGLDLLILKSVDGIRINGVLADLISRPLPTDVVDPLCIPYALNHRIRVTIINGAQTEIVDRFLRGDAVPCTRIGTTF